MGVRFLHTFITDFIPNGLFHVKIKEEIQKWKSEHSTDPFIVFDLFSLWGAFNNSDALMGGRHNLVIKTYEELFRKLTTSGAKLIFFCNGRLPQDQYDRNLIKQNNVYNENIEILDKIEEHGNISFVDKLTKKPLRTSILLALKVVCQRYGEIKILWASTIGPEIARYALKTKVLAIVSDNMDFLIFDGQWKYWSTRSINCETFTASEYNRVELRLSLDLNSKQLAILATIAGNDVLPYDGNVKQFHRKKLHTSYKTHFNKLADYVRALPLEITFEEIKKISEDIYESNDFTSQIKASIDMYNITADSEIEKEQENELISLSKTTHNKYLYVMLKGLPIKLLQNFMDLRRTDFVSYFDLIKPILQRSVGVVRSHISETNYMQVVISKVHHDEPYTELMIAPEYPKHIEIPNPMHLIFNNDDDTQLHQLRLDLVNWIIFGDSLKKLNIEEIPKGYVVAVLAVKYLLNFNQLTSVEADAILLCIFNVHNNRVPAQIESKNVDVRTIIVSNLYAKMHDEITLCFMTVGLSKFITNDYLMHDGPHFGVLFNDLKKKSDEEYEIAISGILPIRQFVYQV